MGRPSSYPPELRDRVEFDSLTGPRCDDAIWPHLLSGWVAVTI